MISKTWRLLAPLIALGLLAALVLTGMTLRDRLGAEKSLDDFESSLSESSSDHASAIERLAALDVDAMSADQRSRWSRFLSDRAGAQIMRDLLIVCRSGDFESRTNLQTALARGLTVPQRAFDIQLELIKGSPMAPLIQRVSLAEETFDVQGTGVARSFDIAEGTQGRVLKLEVEANRGDGLGDAGRWDVPVSVDQTAPTVEFGVSRGRLEEDERQLTVFGSDVLEVQVSDDIQLSRLIVTWRGETLVDQRLEGSLAHTWSFIHGLEIDDSGTLLVELRDAVDQETRREMTLRRHAKTQAVLESLSAAGVEDVRPDSRISFSNPRLNLRCRVRVDDPELRLSFVPGDGNPVPLNADESGAEWMLSDYAVPDDKDEISCQLLAENGENTKVLSAFTIFRDVDPPRILIHRNGKDLLDIPELQAEAGDQFELQLVDASAIRRDLTTTAGGGLQFVGEGTWDSDGRFRRAFALADAEYSTLAVRVEDRHGNRSERNLTFRIPQTPPEDDGEGPRFELRQGEHVLTSEGENVLWRSDGKLRLTIRDASGFEVKKLSISGARTLEELPQGHATRREVTIEHDEGPVVVEIEDRYGNAGRQTFQLTRIRSAPEFRGANARHDGREITISTLPVEFKVAMKETPPEGFVRAFLKRIDSEAAEIPITLEQLNARIDDVSPLQKGVWQVVVALRTVGGETTIGTASIVSIP